MRLGALRRHVNRQIVLQAQHFDAFRPIPAAFNRGHEATKIF
jgi:hypothetical protein